MVLIHEKITALLEQRRLKKRDLARALGVSPQTATDICKGRSAITLPHLRNLVSFFEIRAEFWLDDDRLTPEDVDQVARKGTADAIQRTGLLAAEDPPRLVERLRTFVQSQREAFEARFPDLTAAERGVLGLGDGAVGQVAATPPPSAQATGSQGSGSQGSGSQGSGSQGAGSQGAGSEASNDAIAGAPMAAREADQ
ncbi:MAG: transcriptional regulator [Planctomycetota bacterium]